MQPQGRQRCILGARWVLGWGLGRSARSVLSVRSVFGAHSVYHLVFGVRSMFSVRSVFGGTNLHFLPLLGGAKLSM